MLYKVIFLIYTLLIADNTFTASTNITLQPTDHIPASLGRKAQGFYRSPYSWRATLRYVFDFLTNGRFSLQNSTKNSMILLPLHGSMHVPCNACSQAHSSSLKMIFLGDIMVSKSGLPPVLDARMKNLLESADIIVANVESPVVETKEYLKRTFSLRFQMNITYLQHIYNANPRAQWVFSVANNHAFDTSDKDSQDISGLITTANVIKKHLPKAEVIGANIPGAHSLLSLKTNSGLTLGILSWTDIMNNDTKHYLKPALRGHDLTPAIIAHAKSKAGIDVLIGFPHGNQEQSFQPVDQWAQFIGPTLCNIIVGTGPHVVQPAEAIHQGLLFHSIGDFFSPSGGSQTKVGCIPEFTLKTAKKEVSIDYTINLLQQNREHISLINVHSSEVLYPEIIDRLKKGWKTLFNEALQ